MFQDASEPDSPSRPGVIAGRLFTTLVIFLFCYGAASLVALGQLAPKSSDIVDTKPNTTPRGPRTPRPPRQPRASGVTGGSEQSDKFLALGDGFADKSRWRAAEASYREAITIWQGNADAWLGLGDLFVRKGTLGEAYGIHKRLLSLDSQFAAYLMSEIKAKEKKP